MNSAQSPHIPEKGQRPRAKDLGWLVLFGARGLFELTRARIIFSRLEAKAIPGRNLAAKTGSRPQFCPDQAWLDRIVYVLPRLSERLPWRSDCLVQALAGQNWLSSAGAASEIQIGVEHPKDAESGEFGAHAWLMHKEQVITGGEIDRYHLILSESAMDRDSGV